MSDGAKDVFGYNNTSLIGGVLNFQNAAIKIGDSKNNSLMLVQSANLRYNRTVSPVMGAGTTTVYLVPQPGTGQLDVNRAITTDSSILDPYAAGDACKTLSVQIALLDNGCVTGAKKGSITADGLLSGVTIQINVGGGLGLQDGASWTLTNLKINK